MLPNASDIRSALLTKLSTNAPSAATWLSEVQIAGGIVRADLVQVGDKIVAFELKSDRDSVRRLTRQAWYYSKAFDEVHLVVGPRHHDTVTRMLPSWWGLWVIEASPLSVHLLRAPGQNPAQEKCGLASLLSRPELAQILRATHRLSELKTLSVADLWNLVAQVVGEGDLRRLVRSALLARCCPIVTFAMAGSLR